MSKTNAATTDPIRTQAHVSAAELLAQGWTAAPEAYDTGTYFGDADALADRLGRPTTPEERRALTQAIRAELAEQSDPMGYADGVH